MPPRKASLELRKSSEKMATSARQISKSCSTCCSSGQGVLDAHSSMWAFGIKIGLQGFVDSQLPSVVDLCVFLLALGRIEIGQPEVRFQCVEQGVGQFRLSDLIEDVAEALRDRAFDGGKGLRELFGIDAFGKVKRQPMATAHQAFTRIEVTDEIEKAVRVALETRYVPASV